MGRIVIAAYRPKPGRQADLERLARSHYRRLSVLGLVTGRLPVLMCAADGTVVEVFEWTSAAAIAAAHEHPQVLAMWEEYGEVCDYVPIGDVAEARSLFAEFQPLLADQTLHPEFSP